MLATSGLENRLNVCLFFFSKKGEDVSGPLCLRHMIWVHYVWDIKVQDVCDTYTLSGCEHA